MNRKNYQAPSIRVVELHSSQLLNESSDGPVQAPRYVYDNFDEEE